MLTGLQIRIARTALRWSAQELAERTGLALKTIQRLETFDGIPASHTGTVATIQYALEATGIEFIGSPEDSPGIRIHPRPAAG
jgi:transcriptional regulator with XRE-family HTH domain